MTVHVWHDWLGVWYASVTLTGNLIKDARTAREAIHEELTSQAPARAWDTHKLVVNVRRERVTNHGTVVYRAIRREVLPR